MTTRPCPNNPTTQSACSAVPNALWIGTSSTSGTCVCCAVDGTAYVNSSATTATDVCKTCPSGQCASPTAFCGNTGVTGCTQNTNTLAWTAGCTAGSVCGGACTGTCDNFLQTCMADANGKYSCGYAWWVYLVGIVIILIVLVFFIWLIFAFVGR